MASIDNSKLVQEAEQGKKEYPGSKRRKITFRQILHVKIRCKRKRAKVI
jgi:hypothetical protein